MEVIKETLWKRCLSNPTKLHAKNSSIFLSETAYQHKGTRKKCKKTIQAAIIQWQQQCLMYKPHHIASPYRSRKQATFLSRVPVHCITPFCSDALVSPPNLYPPCFCPYLKTFVQPFPPTRLTALGSRRMSTISFPKWWPLSKPVTCSFVWHNKSIPEKRDTDTSTYPGIPWEGSVNSLI